MGNPGKNKLERFARLYVNAYNLSGDTRSVGGFGVGFGEVDFTAWDNTIREMLTDKRLSASITDYQAYFNDTANSGSFDNLKTVSAGMEVSVAFGGNAEPTYGDPAYFLVGAQMSSNSTFDGGAGMLNASWYADTVDYNEWPLGHLISPEVSRSATFDGTTLDNGAATTAGWHAQLHLVASTGGTWVLKVRHSTDDISYADLGTFVLDGSVVGSEHIGGTGTVNRYIQFQGTRTSGDITPVCVFARNR